MATVAGIDIGSESIKGVVLSSGKSGPVEVLAVGTLPLGDLGQMPDSPDKTLAVGSKLKELVRTARLRGNVRRVGATGKVSSIRYIQVPPVPPWRLDMLVAYEVQEKSGDKEANTFDYHILDVPEVGGQYTVMIGMLKEDAAADLLSVAKTSGLGEVELDLEALALYNAYYHGHGFDSDKTVLIADIGAEDLTILLVKNGGLYFARTMSGAAASSGRRFTQVLADELKIEFQEAEEIKKTQAEIVFDITPATPGRTARLQRPGGMTGIMSRQSGTAMMTRPAAGAAKEDTPKAEAAPSTPKPEAPTAAGDASSPLTLSFDLNDSSNDTILTTDPLAPALSLSPSAPAAPAAPSSPPPLPATPAAVSPSASTIASIPPVLPPSANVSSSRTPGQGGPESFEDRRRRQISGAMLREAAGLCAALENAVLYTKQQTKLRELKIDRLYLTGGGSKLKGLSEFMSRRMRMEVMPLEPFKQLSLSRMPPEQAEALKAEQHTMAVSLGLSLAELQKGGFSFLLWPESLKQRKIFWARGAYLYYSAALAIVALLMFLITPYRNATALAANFEAAESGVSNATSQSAEVKKLSDSNEELQNQLKQIADNTSSGHYFLHLLAELKNTNRISNDVWLTQVSTNLPQVIRKLSGETTDAPKANAAAPTRADVRKAAAENAEPDTFQTQRRVYLRGFARGDNQGEGRIKKIREFYERLLPHPDDPDNPANLFKDVRPLWFSTEEIKHEDYYLTEFVLEAYTEGTRTLKKTEGAKAAPKAVAAPAEGAPAPVPLAQPAAGEPAAPVNPQPIPQAQPKAVPQAVPQAQPKAVPQAQPVAPAPQAQPAAPEPPKKKKFIEGAPPPAKKPAGQ